MGWHDRRAAVVERSVVAPPPMADRRSSSGSGLDRSRSRARGARSTSRAGPVVLGAAGVVRRPRASRRGRAHRVAVARRTSRVTPPSTGAATTRRAASSAARSRRCRARRATSTPVIWPGRPASPTACASPWLHVTRRRHRHLASWLGAPRSAIWCRAERRSSGICGPRATPSTLRWCGPRSSPDATTRRLASDGAGSACSTRRAAPSPPRRSGSTTRPCPTEAAPHRTRRSTGSAWCRPRAPSGAPRRAPC